MTRTTTKFILSFHDGESVAHEVTTTATGRTIRKCIRPKSAPKTTKGLYANRGFYEWGFQSDRCEMLAGVIISTILKHAISTPDDMHQDFMMDILCSPDMKISWHMQTPIQLDKEAVSEWILNYIRKLMS